VYPSEQLIEQACISMRVKCSKLPHIGAEQPQDIYYFSAITVNAFGIADVTGSNPYDS